MFPNIDTHTSIRIHGADEVKQVARGAEVTRVVHGVEKKGETSPGRAVQDLAPELQTERCRQREQVCQVYF